MYPQPRYSQTAELKAKTTEIYLDQEIQVSSKKGWFGQACIIEMHKKLSLLWVGKGKRG